MENISDHISSCFNNLVEKFGLLKKNEIDDDHIFSVEFSAKNFTVKLEKYRHEFYATLYKIDRPDHEINLFNLIQYLNQSSSDIPESNYFIDEVNIEKCYRKQIKYIASTISDYFAQIDEFFSHKYFDSELENLNRFMVEKYPELFGKN